MIGGIGKTGSFDSASISQYWQSMFTKLDTSGDGSIDKSELGAVANKSGQGSGIAEILAKLDTNNDGSISKSESDSALTEMEQLMSIADFSLNLNMAGGSGRLNNSFVSTLEPSTEDIFSAIDTNSDGSIDKTELQSFLQNESSTNVDTAFSVLDTDGDGKISQSELDAALNSMKNDMGVNAPPPPPPPLMMSTGQSSEDIFSAIDTNGDGSVDKTELQSFLQNESSTNVDTVFSAIDTNGDGIISQSELDATLNTMKNDMAVNAPPPPPPPPPMMSEEESSEDIFSAIDTNGDGSIDKTELQSFLDTNSVNAYTTLGATDDGNAVSSESKTNKSNTDTNSESNSFADLAESSFDARILKNKMLMEILNAYTIMSSTGSDDASASSISLFG